jgi:hypothetical protein
MSVEPRERIVELRLGSREEVDVVELSGELRGDIEARRIDSLMPNFLETVLDTAAPIGSACDAGDCTDRSSAAPSRGRSPAWSCPPYSTTFSEG